MFLNDFDMLILKIKKYFNMFLIKNYLALIFHNTVELIIY
jgi:hypothetical protein